MSMSDWQPGDPIHDRGPVCYSTYLFNFRDAEDNFWGDAARWPEPHSSRVEIEDDPLASCVAWHRAVVKGSQACEIAPQRPSGSQAGSYATVIPNGRNGTIQSRESA